MEESFADVHRFSDNSKTDFERDRSALSSYLNNNDKNAELKIHTSENVVAICEGTGSMTPDGEDRSKNEFKQNHRTVLHNSHDNGNPVKFTQLSTLAAMLIAWVVVIWYYSVHKDDFKSSPFTIKQTFHRKLKLILFGDSLITYPDENYKFVEEIQQRLPGFTVVKSAQSGEHVDALIARFNGEVAQQHPDLVFLFWNSDMSFSPVPLVMNPQYQAYYTQQTIKLISAIKNVTDVIVSGPTLFSEGPIFRPERYKGRNPTLKHWTAMNAKICRQLNVAHIDMHTPFKNSIPLFWLFYKWYVTSDGEHGNSRGVALIADKLVESVGVWLKGKHIK